MADVRWFVAGSIPGSIAGTTRASGPWMVHARPGASETALVQVTEQQSEPAIDGADAGGSSRLISRGDPEVVASRRKGNDTHKNIYAGVGAMAHEGSDDARAAADRSDGEGACAARARRWW